MIVLHCDKCKKETKKVNSFNVTFYNIKVINKSSIIHGSEIEMSHRIELCEECSKKFMEDYSLEVKNERNDVYETGI